MSQELAAVASVAYKPAPGREYMGLRDDTFTSDSKDIVGGAQGMGAVRASRVYSPTRDTKSFRVFRRAVN